MNYLKVDFLEITQKVKVDQIIFKEKRVEEGPISPIYSKQEETE